MRHASIETRRLLWIGLLALGSVQSVAIETNPFVSLSELNGNSLGIVNAIDVGDGVVWLAADNGIFGLQGDITFHYGSEVKGFDSAVQDIEIGSRDTVWAATFGNGLFSFHNTNGELLRLDESDGLLSDYVLRLEYLSGRYLVIATINGVQIFDVLKGQLLTLAEMFNLRIAAEESDIVKLNQNSFFLLSKTKSYIFDIAALTYDQIFLPEKVYNSFVYRVYQDQYQKLWISTSSGTFSYDLDANFGQHHILETPNNINARDFLHLEGSGTIVAAEGIYQYDERRNTIEVTELLSPFMDNGTIGVISDLERSKAGLILVGGPVFGLTWLPQTFESISYLNFQSQSAKGKVEGVVDLEDKKSVISLSGKLYSLSDFKKGALELVNNPDSSSFRSIVKLDTNFYAISERDEIVSIDLDKLEVLATPSSKVEVLIEDKVKEIEVFGNKLVGLTQENKIFYLFEGQITYVDFVHFEPDIIFTSEDIFVAVDYFNRVMISNDMSNWFGLDHGTLNEEIAIECIEKTITGTVYFCTSGNGVVTIEPETTKIVPSKLNKFIDSKYIRGIKSDKKGNLWIATNSGLYRAERNGNWVQKVTQKEGVIDLDFEFEGLHLNQINNSLLVVGDKLNYLIELEKFNSVMDQYLDKSNRLLISRVKNFAGVGEDSGYIATEEASESGTQVIIENDVYLTEISFASNDAIDHRYLEFEYRLLGLNENWRRAPKGNASATFSTLPFGNYTFQARAIDQSSLMEQPIESLEIRVLPPIWLTGEAFLVYFLILVVMYVASIFWQRTLAKSRGAEIDGVVNEKTATLTLKYEATTNLLEKKKTLFSSLSHEMRTPLTIILGWIKQLQDSGQFKKANEKLFAMQQNSMRLKVLVDQLLELERLETVTDLPMKSHNIHKLLVLITESFKPLTQEKFIEVTIKGNKKLEVAASEGSLDRIFSNIISNAIKYTPEDGTITLYIREKAGMAEISIADSGDGLSEEEQDTIFTRFSRLEKHESITGSGIGLALVKELVTANDGFVSVSSEIGLGATFIVQLPVASESLVKSSTLTNIERLEFDVSETKSALKDSKSNSDEIVDIDSTIKSVLIIDDSEDIREYLNSILSTEYRCIHAINGKDGYEIATNMLPDAIVSDVVMPVMDGLKLTNKLREQDITSHIPIILVSAKGDEESKIAGLTAKADDYLIKPFNENELILKIRQLINTRDSQAEAYFEKHEEVLASPNIVEADLPEFKNERDQRFYTTLLLTTFKHYTEDSYSRDVAADALNCTDRQLNRKLNALVDSNFTNFLKKFRLEQAKKLLLETGKVGSVAYDVGFASPSYFGSCFKIEYGETPKEYIDRHLSNSNDL